MPRRAQLRFTYYAGIVGFALSFAAPGAAQDPEKPGNETPTQPKIGKAPDQGKPVGARGLRQSIISAKREADAAHAIATSQGEDAEAKAKELKPRRQALRELQRKRARSFRNATRDMRRFKNAARRKGDKRAAARLDQLKSARSDYQEALELAQKAAKQAEELFEDEVPLSMAAEASIDASARIQRAIQQARPAFQRLRQRERQRRRERAQKERALVAAKTRLGRAKKAQVRADRRLERLEERGHKPEEGEDASGAWARAKAALERAEAAIEKGRAAREEAQGEARAAAENHDAVKEALEASKADMETLGQWAVAARRHASRARQAREGLLSEALLAREDRQLGGFQRAVTETQAQLEAVKKRIASVKSAAEEEAPGDA